MQLLPWSVGQGCRASALCGGLQSCWRGVRSGGEPQDCLQQEGVGFCPIAPGSHVTLPSPVAPGSARSPHAPWCRSGRSSGIGMLLLAEEVRVPPGPNTQLL